jgi:hypothetical protein
MFNLAITNEEIKEILILDLEVYQTMKQSNNQTI